MEVAQTRLSIKSIHVDNCSPRPLLPESQLLMPEIAEMIVLPFFSSIALEGPTRKC